MKRSIFWDITPYNPLKFNRRFGVKFRLHLQGRKMSQVRKKRKAGSKQQTSVCLVKRENKGNIHFAVGRQFILDPKHPLGNDVWILEKSSALKESYSQPAELGTSQSGRL
jgi:hypothetical protein